MLATGGLLGRYGQVNKSIGYSICVIFRQIPKKLRNGSISQPAIRFFNRVIHYFGEFVRNRTFADDLLTYVKDCERLTDAHKMLGISQTLLMCLFGVARLPP